MLPGRLTGARGYFGVGDFMVYEDKMACCKRKWVSDIVLRENDIVCNDFSCSVGYWGVEKSPGPGVEAEKIVQDVCSGCDRILISGTPCNTLERLFLSSVTAEGMLKLKWWRSGNWPVISVDRRVSGC